MKTKIEFDDDNLTYQNIGDGKVKGASLFFIILIIIIIFICSTIFTILQGFNFKPLVELSVFKRIKRNMNSWLNLTQEKTGIEITKGKLFLLTTAKAGEFRVMDFDSFYAVGRINPTSYLPEFLRRGNSGPWIISKAAKNDLSAKQFAEFLLTKHILSNANIDNTIVCGIDMYNKLGYSGYFNSSSVCELTISYLKKNLNS